MKKIAFFLSFIFIAIISLTVETTKAQDCPAGFVGPRTDIFMSNGCFVRVSWCCKMSQDGGPGSGSLSLPDISIVKVEFLSPDPEHPDIYCAGLQWAHDIYGNNVIVIPWDEIMEQIINSGLSCFDPLQMGTPNIDPCPGGTNRGQLRVYSGWCLSFTPGHYQGMEWINPAWTKCSYQPPTEMAKCHEWIKICYEMINGQPHYKIISSEGSYPQFTCNVPCEQRCAQ